MPFLRQLLVIAVCCVLALPGRSQPPTWKPMRFGKISLNYPSTWHMSREAHGEQTRVTLTPDSMQHLTMRIIEIFELPLSGDHTYANFRSGFASILEAQPEAGIKVTRSEETTFKGHKTMYAEIIRNSLPGKVYGIDGGTDIYLLFVLPRRYAAVPDPALERDEKVILNSIAFDHY